LRRLGLAEKWFEKKPRTEKINTVVEKKNTSGIDTAFSRGDTGSTRARNSVDSLLNNKTGDSIQTKPSITLPREKEKIIVAGDEKITMKSGQGIVSRKKKETASRVEATNKKKAIKNNTTLPADKKEKDRSTADSTGLDIVPVKQKPDPANNMITKTVVPDSARKTKKDSTIKKPAEDIPASDKKPKKDSLKSKKIIFSAGIGLHQQLPVAGQKWSPYNSTGRKTSLADYIPSVYLRATRPGKWFLQAEFRYGAPQFTKEFTYRSRSVPDTGSNPQFNTNTSSTLKKTFYHQLPVTFNYFIMPNWSFGAGFQWNKFKAAVSEKNILKHNNFTQQDSLVSKLIETSTKDSANEFVKSYFQFVLETQYQWKRFSFGAKYSFGLQPYIKFTIPGQPEKQERNNALQVFIRYELWKRKNKK